MEVHVFRHRMESFPYGLSFITLLHARVMTSCLKVLLSPHRSLTVSSIEVSNFFKRVYSYRDFYLNIPGKGTVVGHLLVKNSSSLCLQSHVTPGLSNLLTEQSGWILVERTIRFFL